MKKRSIWLSILVAFAVLMMPAIATAEIMASGDVSPGKPDNWTKSTYGSIGQSGVGGVTVRGGSGLVSKEGYLGRYVGSTGEAFVDGAGSTWNNSGILYVGLGGNGTLGVTDGGTVYSGGGRISDYSGSSGVVTVDGVGSAWNNSGNLYVSLGGNGTLSITDGGIVNNSAAYVADYAGAMGAVTVAGVGSAWNNTSDLYLGRYGGSGTLAIAEGGLVRVDGALTIDNDYDHNSFVNMSAGGMLALCGKADDSLDQFLDLVGGTGSIRYWNGDSWSSLNDAVAGKDYRLNYKCDGDLAGHTVLTVGPMVPEPSMVALLATSLGGFLFYVYRKRR